MCKKIRPNSKMDNNLVNLPGLMDILPNITYHLDCDRLGFSMKLTPGNLSRAIDNKIVRRQESQIV